MLKPITQPFCCGALNACLELQMHLLRWLCDPTTGAADVTQINLVPPRVPTQIEANWLWRYLYGRKQTRLDQAKIIAGMSAAEKIALLGWSNSVVAVADQFLVVDARKIIEEVEAAVDRWDEFASIAGVPQAVTERTAKNLVLVGKKRKWGPS